MAADETVSGISSLVATGSAVRAGKSDGRAETVGSDRQAPVVGDRWSSAVSLSFLASRSVVEDDCNRAVSSCSQTSPVGDLTSAAGRWRFRATAGARDGDGAGDGVDDDEGIYASDESGDEMAMRIWAKISTSISS